MKMCFIYAPRERVRVVGLFSHLLCARLLQIIYCECIYVTARARVLQLLNSTKRSGKRAVVFEIGELVDIGCATHALELCEMLQEIFSNQ